MWIFNSISTGVMSTSKGFLISNFLVNHSRTVKINKKSKSMSRITNFKLSNVKTLSSPNSTPSPSKTKQIKKSSRYGNFDRLWWSTSGGELQKLIFTTCHIHTPGFKYDIVNQIIIMMIFFSVKLEENFKNWLFWMKKFITW